MARSGLSKHVRTLQGKLTAERFQAVAVLTSWKNLFICDECFDRLGFERFTSLADLPPEDRIEITDGRWEAFEAAYGAIEGRQLFCLKCIAEIDQRNSSRLAGRDRTAFRTAS
jgi:hypothetical protein